MGIIRMNEEHLCSCLASWIIISERKSLSTLGLCLHTKKKWHKKTTETENKNCNQVGYAVDNNVTDESHHSDEATSGPIKNLFLTKMAKIQQVYTDKRVAPLYTINYVERILTPHIENLLCNEVLCAFILLLNPDAVGVLHAFLVNWEHNAQKTMRLLLCQVNLWKKGPGEHDCLMKRQLIYFTHDDMSSHKWR